MSAGNRKFNRQFSQNIKDTSYEIGKQTLSFFGVSCPNDEEVAAWNQRRLRFTLQKFGNINTDKLENEVCPTPTPNIISEEDENEVNHDRPPLPQFLLEQNYARPSFRRGKSAPGVMNRQISLKSNLALPIEHDGMETIQRKSNAVKVIGKVIASKASRKTPHPTPIVQKQFSFSQQQINTTHDEGVTDDFFANFSGLKQKKKISRHLHKNPVFRFICCLMKHDRDTESICSRINDCYQYRPYFSYWITCVQVIIFVVGCLCYGFAPVSFQLETHYQKLLMSPNQELRDVCWNEYDNLWLGPRHADLIRMGARYSPCMRTDKNWNVAIKQAQLNEERRSSCCIRNDGGGCYQAPIDKCSLILSSQYSWQMLSRINQINISRSSGPVCGQDPRFCTHPPSQAPFEWSDDITKWNICVITSKLNGSLRSTNPHMSCEITGRPCCAGIKGECIITSPEHCTFIRGYYHPEAYLCSQVNCLSEICGMIGFEDSAPDQIYRLLTSIFLHVGLVHLLITILLQLLFLRDFEKMMGWHRTSIIYIFSGVLGNLTSAVFLPYKVEAGPSGAYFAFLSIIIIELIKSWNVIRSPTKVLLKYTVFTLFMLFIGLLPWIDNYAHISGLISGVLLSFVFLPFLGIPKNKHNSKGTINNSNNNINNNHISKNSNNDINKINNATKNSNTDVSKNSNIAKNSNISKLLHGQQSLNDSIGSSSIRSHHWITVFPNGDGEIKLKRRQIIIWRLMTIFVCAIIWIALFVALLLSFKYHIVLNCDWCKYLTCIPLAGKNVRFCRNMDMNISERTPCLNI